MTMRLSKLIVGVALLLAAAGVTAAELRDFDATTPEKIAVAHAGKPYVLVLWSIHCEPCRAEMSQWPVLHRRYPGVDFVLVATDPPKERRQIAKVLSRYDMRGLQTFAYSDEFEDRVRYAVDRNWRGELPRTYLYDSGHRVQARSGLAERGWIEPWLERQTAALPDVGNAPGR
jgi:thiol-disulfide isomerase/thioredoxin